MDLSFAEEVVNQLIHYYTPMIPKMFEDDLKQEIMCNLALQPKPKDYEDRDWIKLVTRSTSIDFYRKHIKHKKSTEIPNDVPEDTKGQELDRDLVLTLDMWCNPLEKKVINLYRAGYNYKEIADKMGWGSKTYVYRILKQIYDKLKEN